MANDSLQRLRTVLTWGDDVYSMSFDAVVQEDYSRTAEVTAFPVESGAVIADHVQPNQTELRLEVHASNTPIHVPGDHVDAGVTGKKQNSEAFREYLDNRPIKPATISLPSGRLVRNIAAHHENRASSAAQVLVFEGGKLNRVANIFNQLDELIATGEVMTVHTHLRHFENMVIKGVEAGRDALSGSGLTFALEFVQIEVAERGKVTGGTQPRHKKHEDKKDAGGETEAPTEAEKTDMMTKAWRWMTGEEPNPLQVDLAPPLPGTVP